MGDRIDLLIGRKDERKEKVKDDVTFLAGPVGQMMVYQQDRCILVCKRFGHGESEGCDGQNNDCPKGVHSLASRTCDYVTICGKETLET